MLVLKPDWVTPPWVRCLTTTRQTGDFFQAAARARLEQFVNCEHMAWLSQCHGKDVVLAEESLLCAADGSCTAKPKIACVVRTADCLPVLLSAKQTHWVSAVHAGWQGLYQNILAEAIAQAPQNATLTAWIGPSIGRQAYAVSPEFRLHFLKRYPHLTQAFLWRGTQCYCDLTCIAQAQLLAAGVTDIALSGYCTYRDAQLFDSYRRQGNVAGRQATVIWIDKSS
jgi:YfiH family protein